MKKYLLSLLLVTELTGSFDLHTKLQDSEKEDYSLGTFMSVEEKSRLPASYVKEAPVSHVTEITGTFN